MPSFQRSPYVPLSTGEEESAESKEESRTCADEGLASSIPAAYGRQRRWVHRLATRRVLLISATLMGLLLLSIWAATEDVQSRALRFCVEKTSAYCNDQLLTSRDFLRL